MSSPDQESSKSVDSSNLNGRRHSISCADPRDRAILHSASETRLPLRILARSLASDSAAGGSPPVVPQPAIDVKFIQMYVKKMGPNFRQNSDPTFNRRRRQRSMDTASNSGQSSSRASSNDEVPNIRSITVTRACKNQDSKSIRRSSSGDQLKNPDPDTDDPDPLVMCYRILESLFAGGVDAASNGPLLCKLKIDQLIDLRNMEKSSNFISLLDESAVRCVCDDRRHTRKLINMSVSDLSISNLMDSFKRLNALITNARGRGEKTLLFDQTDGGGLAAWMVTQYLMYYYHMKYSAAQAFVQQIINGVHANEKIQEALLVWQNELNESTTNGSRAGTVCGFHEVPIEPDNDLPPCLQKKQIAWN